jgi:hypothetical protein
MKYRYIQLLLMLNYTGKHEKQIDVKVHHLYGCILD